MNKPSPGGMRQSSTPGTPSRHAHAVVAAASTCLLSLAAALFLALGAPDEHLDQGTAAVRDVNRVLHP